MTLRERLSKMTSSSTRQKVKEWGKKEYHPGPVVRGLLETARRATKTGLTEEEYKAEIRKLELQERRAKLTRSQRPVTDVLGFEVGRNPTSVSYAQGRFSHITPTPVYLPWAKKPVSVKKKHKKRVKHHKKRVKHRQKYR